MPRRHNVKCYYRETYILGVFFFNVTSSNWTSKERRFEKIKILHTRILFVQVLVFPIAKCACENWAPNVAFSSFYSESHCSDHCEILITLQLSGRMPDSQSGEPGFESSLCLCFEVFCIFVLSTMPQSTQLY